ncbi:hypothetical protein JIQ42_00432 [Leishmania sp. Namibia]|uniref:hypothetical protein n=1 Tax=Leishmania sp. Namibia TaxID=2802991 RepID=UPI001B63B3CB|nr:hypothetical protein JIQ42_00432 [Leishmania sp. Namibia]
MPRNICRVPAAQHSNPSAASQATPAPRGDACEKTDETAPLSSTAARPTRAKHHGRGRPRVYPSKTSFAQSLNPHLTPVKPESGNHEDPLTTAASLPVFSPVSTAVSIAESATTTNHVEVAQSAETVEAEVALSSQPPSPPPFSSRHIPEAPSLATGVPADTEQGGQETVAFSRAPSDTSIQVAAAVSDSTTAVAALRAASSGEPFLPSMAACMTACFGWRLKRCSIGDEDKIMFVLRHQAVPVVRVTIEGTEGAFAQACCASSETDAGVVRVNGTLMSLTQCAAYLHELTHALFNLSGTSQSGPLTDHVPAEEENAGIQDAESVSSPSAQLKAAERRAKKRVRSRSPSRQARSTAPVLRSAALPSDVTVRSITEASAAAAGGEGEANTERSRRHLPPLGSSTSPPTSAPLTTPPPAFRTTVDVKVKAEAPLFATPLKRAEQKSGEDTASLSAVAALVAEMESSESSAPLPRAPPASRISTGKLSAASKRAASSVDKCPASREAPTSSTVFASPTMRQRRALVTTIATAAAAVAGSASPVSGAHHAPPASPSSPHVGLRTGSFTMPFAFHHASAAPLAADVAPEDVDVVSGSKTGHGSLWCDSGGWLTDSSRLWLAHTHAVSRTFECMPVPRFSGLVPTRATKTLDSGHAEVQRTSAAVSASSSSPLTDTAAAAALVRMALRLRWRERSSIWMTMDDSLRMAVGSGHLRGDALEAAVQALQASEEEQCQYNGMDADADEDGDNCGSSYGRTAPDVGHAGHGPVQLQTPLFPACPPRALLPVSGRAVVEAQRRIADAAEEIGGEKGAHGPRYVACAGGIPYAGRIVIDHTYSTRGSYVIAPPEMAERSTATPCRFLTLQRNAHEDLHYHVYKRYMPTDMRLAMEAEGTLSVGPGGIAPLQEPSAELPSAYNLRRDQSGGEADDIEDDEERDDGGEEADEKKAFGSSTASQVTPGAPAVTNGQGASGGGPSADIDYVLRYRPAIRRIPMPDVESRYGP